MHRNTKLWLMWLGLLLVAALLAPAAAPAVQDPGNAYEMQREKLCKDLNLTPEKSKEFKGVEDKFRQSRKEIVDRMRQSEGELEKALAAPQPEEGKIKQLVAAITADHGKLLDSFRGQRQEEMALLTPVQQGQFIICLRKWHTEIRDKYQQK
jgi:Spy/CpxP family protein refolding chaperone